MATATFTIYGGICDANLFVENMPTLFVILFTLVGIKIVFSSKFPKVKPLLPTPLT